ncbi:MAG: type II toxin-antitoxin system VapC family toxin [Bacteroidota bacterium]
MDTNIILYLLNGDKTLETILDQKELSISVITELELLSFPEISPVEESSIRNLISGLNVININTDIKDNTIKLRRGYNLKLPDAIIESTACCMNLPLISTDKLFTKVPNWILFYMIFLLFIKIAGRTGNKNLYS